LMKETEFAALMEKKAASGISGQAATAMASALNPGATTAATVGTARPAAPARVAPTVMVAAAPAAASQSATGPQSVPVPALNPLAFSAPAQPDDTQKKPFWKFWSKQ
jgi:hypothetical protein